MLFDAKRKARTTAGLNESDGDDEDISLYTAIIAHTGDQSTVYVFAAMIARSSTEVRRKLRNRVGNFLENAALVKLGFDRSESLACVLVSEALAGILLLAAEDPLSEIALGLDVHVEQRFDH